MRAPLNPILGETLQRELPDGTRFFAEQTSHHPPITNFYLEGPGGCYRFSGFAEYKAWLAGLNSIGGARVGK
jgi:Oxysterol-binding protein